MKRFTALAAACAALLTISATIAYAKIGEPISGVPVGLEHSPPDDIVARAVTNGEGNITFNNLKSGRYTFVLLDTSALKVPCRMAVTFSKGTAKLPISEPILPGKRGSQAFALDESGRKLTVIIGESGGQIAIHVQADMQGAHPRHIGAQPRYTKEIR